ncbi:MAG: GNAT family N-acetyltransferase [Xenococcaceae cyanobacterium]
MKVSQAEFSGDRSCNLFIFDNRTNTTTVLGFINFFAFIRGAFHACILGYGLAESMQGRGLMTESLHLGIDYIFDEFNYPNLLRYRCAIG